MSRLESFAVFADLPVEELDRIAGAMSEVQIEACDTVVTDGEYGYVLYFVEDGEADVLVDGSQQGTVSGPATRSARSRSSSPDAGRPPSWPGPR